MFARRLLQTVRPRRSFSTTPPFLNPNANTEFQAKPLAFLDYLQRTITLSLFAITCAGAYTLGEGAIHIIGKRYGFITVAPPADTPIDTENKAGK